VVAPCSSSRASARLGAGGVTPGGYGRAVSEDVAEFPAPQLLTTNIVDTAADAVEAVHAADVLGFGVRLYNRLVPDIEDDSLVEEWVVEVFTSAPAVDPEGQTDED
jgi:hypothetical protein